MATTNAEQQQPEVIEPRRESIIVDAPHEKEGAKAEAPADYTKTIDKMGNELGELRKQNRELMQALQGLQQGSQAEPEKFSYEDNPTEFIQQAIGTAIEERLGPKLQVLESDLHQRRATTFDEKLSQTYPDWKETAQTEDFANWVKASPARTQMYVIADQNFDVDSATELMKRFRQDQAEAQKNQKGAIDAAGMVEGGGDSSGVKVYAASEVKHMMETDPEAYRRWLSTEGMAAYNDGRVDQNR